MIHTVLGLAETMGNLVRRRHPGLDIFHIVDESLLQDLIAGGPSAGITSRVAAQATLAERGGASLILFTCSSTSPAVDTARQLVSVPIVKIDDAMAKKAVRVGPRIGLLCTASSTVQASRSLLEQHAAAIGREVVVTPVLEQEAYRARVNGDLASHDAILEKSAAALSRSSDVIVLAQASMAHLADGLAKSLPIPVLASPSLCVESLSDWL